jgi:hypothetical protein
MIEPVGRAAAGLTKAEPGSHRSEMTPLLASGVSAAHSSQSGFYLAALLLGGLVVLWPIYRRVLRWLGTFFLVAGVVLAVATVGGAEVESPGIPGLILGGLGLRVVGGIQPLRALRRQG